MIFQRIYDILFPGRTRSKQKQRQLINDQLHEIKIVRNLQCFDKQNAFMQKIGLEEFKILQFDSKMANSTYRGLPNIGATCYINSFIQTLFMTPEFRDGIYEWTYNQKIHPKREDSILFQLQKLFAKLEMGHSEMSTKDLVKSFQWHEEDAFNQQDIQQFNRVLFEALEKSWRGPKGKENHLIKELYEGQLAHFTKCIECHNESMREETFQDLILIIKNIYEKIYNGSLELSLQRYIKPELLDHNNLYDCSICNKKVQAQRGVKFIKLPKLLNVVLQRFNFDYETMTRNKINDKFSFPFILNFNTFFNGYDQIPNKLNEDSQQYFLEEQYAKPVIKKVMKSTKVVVKTGGTQPAVAGKVKTKPSANTKSFLLEMRRKKLQENMENNEDLIFLSGTAQAPTQGESSNTNSLSAAAKKEQSSNLPEIKEAKEQSTNIHAIPPPPPPLFLQTMAPPTITTPFKSTNVSNEKQNVQGQTLQKQYDKLLIDKQQLSTDKTKDLDEQKLKNKQQIQLFLKDGPLVYELYSILIHSGTSNAGHYFSYIKSFEAERWYSFNDDRVSEINVTQISNTFGGSGKSSAYVLYYRLVEEEMYKLEYKIPDYIKKIIQEEEQMHKMRKIEKLSNLQNMLILKIYYQLGVKTIQIMKNLTLDCLFEKSKDMFNIKIIENEKDVINPQQTASYIKKTNLRLRLFNPSNETKLDTYQGRQQFSLQQLGIKSYQNFLLEIKADSQQFQNFTPGFITIRIALWEDNPHIISLDEKNLQLHKVSVNKFSLMQQIQQTIKHKRSSLLSEKHSNLSENICIVKRHQNDEYLYHEIINLPEYYPKNMDQIGICEGEILFIEADSDLLCWPIQFENQIHRITVKFVNSTNGEHQTILTDSRITLNQLKTTICALIRKPVDEIIMRRGNRSGLELKNGEASLKDNRFISGTTLYLQNGIPAKHGQIRIQLFLASEASVTLFNRLHEFEFIADVPVDSNFKASEVKELFINVLKKQRGLQLKANQIRIREKVNDKMGKIYREKPMKEQQLIEKREIAIELKQDKVDSKDYSIYVRIWDQLNWKLSQKYQFFVNKSSTMKSLAAQIHGFLRGRGELLNMDPEQMDICRILSIHKFNIIDMVDMEYFGMMSDVSVFGEPLFVNSDGLLYIIKKTGIEPRQLTKEEEVLFGGKIKATIRPTKGRTTAHPTNANAKKQKGIVIRVVEKIEQTQEQSEPKKEG